MNTPVTLPGQVAPSNAAAAMAAAAAASAAKAGKREANSPDELRAAAEAREDTGRVSHEELMAELGL